MKSPPEAVKLLAAVGAQCFDFFSRHAAKPDIEGRAGSYGAISWAAWAACCGVAKPRVLGAEAGRASFMMAEHGVTEHNVVTEHTPHIPHQLWTVNSRLLSVTVKLLHSGDLGDVRATRLSLLRLLERAEIPGTTQPRMKYFALPISKHEAYRPGCISL